MTKATLERGATLGRYVVLDKLGGGGMGVVYAAFDPELDRRIAIKLLRPGSGAGATEGRARLLREAQALARLSHPNVIAVHDVGTVDDQIFVAMEYVEGATLGAWVAAERRPWTAVRDMYMQAGRGLAAAHAVGIVHRDFKPDNVLVGKDGRVRVLDFGLAREAGGGATTPADDTMPIESAETAAASSSSALGTPLTREGSFMGTPAYSSPEQLQGEPAGARSDQFSFCVALFEALYGTRPFAGQTISQIVMMMVKGELPAPPPGNRVPPRVRGIVVRGLAIETGTRYPSMDELLAALSHDPSIARRRFAAAGAVLALASVGAYGFFGRTRAEPCTGAEGQLAGIWDGASRSAISRAFTATGKTFAQGTFAGAARVLDGYAQAWVTMSTESCRATRVRGEQSEELLDLRTFCLTKHLAALQAATTLLAHPDDNVVLHAGDIAKHLPELDECADTARLRAVVAPPADPAVRAKIADAERQLATSRALADAQKMQDAAAVLPTAAAVAAIGYKPLEAQLLFARGWVEYQTPDLPTAGNTYRDAIVAAETVGDDLLAAQSWLELSGTLMDQRKLPEARDVIRHVPALLARVGGNPRLEGRFEYYRGWIELYDSKPADMYIERALAIRQRVLPPDDPDLLESLEVEGRRLANRHKIDESLALQRKVLDARKKLYGPDHPSVGESLQNLASAMVKNGDDEAAIPLYTRALEIFERTGSKSFWKRYVLVGLALSSERLGRHEIAVSYAKQAIAFEESLASGLNNPANLASVYAWYGQVLRMHADYPAALEQLERALSIADKYLKPDNDNFVAWWSELGLVKLGLGRAGEAITPLERATALVDARPDSWNPDLSAKTRFALAKALRAAGRDPERARALAQKARDLWAEAGKGKVAEVREVDDFLATP